jgi:hypothetical protein
MDRKSLFCACVFLTIIAGCNPTTTPSDDAGPGLDAHTPPGVDAFVPDLDAFMPGSDAFIPPPDAGPPGCTSDAECTDDGDCTTDSCNTATGNCRHIVTPALCAAGESCNAATGDCEMGSACATDADCEDTDACTTMERCDPAARVCTFRPLDGDGDGDPPRVCGGGDCDDSRSDVSSLDVEECSANGIDNDCDGIVDESAGAVCATGMFCRDNRCLCSEGPEEPCFGICPDFSSDPGNCGSCGMSCGTGTCVASTCTCPVGQTRCMLPGETDFSCYNTASDANNCGSCGNACETGETCISGVCRGCGGDGEPCCSFPACEAGLTCNAGTCSCPGGGSFCTNSGGVSYCTDTMTDEYNCGSCNVNCGRVPVSCMAGECIYTGCFEPMITCGGRMICPTVDPRNCGGCGIVCPDGGCSAGSCT